MKITRTNDSSWSENIINHLQKILWINIFWKIRPTSGKLQTKHRRSSVYFKNGTSIANRSAITRANFSIDASRRVASPLHMLVAYLQSSRATFVTVEMQKSRKFSPFIVGAAIESGQTMYLRITTPVNCHIFSACETCHLYVHRPTRLQDCVEREKGSAQKEYQRSHLHAPLDYDTALSTYITSEIRGDEYCITKWRRVIRLSSCLVSNMKDSRWFRIAYRNFHFPFSK